MSGDPVSRAPSMLGGQCDRDRNIDRSLLCEAAKCWDTSSQGIMWSVLTNILSDVTAGHR